MANFIKRGRSSYLTQLAYLTYLTYSTYLTYPTYLTYLPSQAPNQPARIVGRVVAAETGDPIRGAVVHLVGGSTPVSSQTMVSTDLDGRFMLTERRIGRYSIQVSKPGYVPAMFGRFAEPVDQFELIPGQLFDRGTIRLQVASVISGRVQDGTGEPLADVSVIAWRLEFPQPGIRTWRQVKDTTSNDLGEFRLAGLIPGRYHVAATRTAQPPDLDMRSADYAAVIIPTAGQSQGLLHISEVIAVDTVRGGETSGTAITLVQTRQARVSGSVIDSNGRPGATGFVTIRPAQTEGLPGRRTAEVMTVGGRFTFNSIPIGEYRLTASQPPRAGAGAVLLQSESASLTLSVNEDITGLVLQTQATEPLLALAVSGRVFVDGAPATARLQVLSWSRDENAIAPEALGMPISAVATKPDGQFVLAIGGGWIVLRHLGSPALALKSVTSGGVDVTDGFDVKRAGGPFEVHLTSLMSRVTGVVKDADGAVTPAADVVVYSVDAAAWRLPYSRRAILLRTDDKGRFEATGLPAGQYLAVAPAGLDRAMWADPDRLERWRATATPVSVIDGEVTRVELKRN